MKELLQKPIVRGGVLALLTIATSTSVGLMGNWDSGQQGFGGKIIFFALMTLLYMVMTAFYAKVDVNKRRSYAVLQKQVNSFENLVTGISAICETTASYVNKCIHVVNERHVVDPNIWCFETACKLTCSAIYDNICRLADSKKYGVSYVRLVEEDAGQSQVELIAYQNYNSRKPSIFKWKREFKEIDLESAYEDLCLFKCEKSDVVILIGVDEVNNTFVYRRDSKSSRKKYHLYVGIPVFCDNRKMVGLLQVEGYDDTKFGCITREEVEEAVSKFIIPYGNVFLLLHKMEKALLAGTESAG